MEERLDNPEAYNAEKYFQRAWSGTTFVNKEWASQHGDGKTFMI
jgi:hypothetical protein